MTALGFMGTAGVATLGAIFLASPMLKHAAAVEVRPGPSVIAIQDNGKIFTYPPGAGFSVRLDKEEYPPENLACDTSGVIEPSAAAAASARRWMASSGFQAIAQGECELRDGSFSVHIKVESAEGSAAPALEDMPTGIRGLVTKGPMCETQGGGHACPNSAYQTAVGIYATSNLKKINSTPLITLSTAADGSFETYLPPGEYTVRAGLPVELGGVSEPPCNYANVVVLPHTIAAVSLQCDTGIR